MSTAEKLLRRDARVNRERLMTAASAAFAEHGIETSLEEIARRAGVGIGTLYRHFPTREALVEAIVDEKLTAWLAAAEAAVGRKDAWRGLEEYLGRLVELQLEHRALREILVHHGASEGRVAATRERMRLLLDGLIARAHEQGALRHDFTRADLAVLSWSLGPVLEATADVAPHAVRRHLHFVLDGLRPAAATCQVEPPLDRDQLDAGVRRLHERRFPRRAR
jgi:AcrR family transcriptional regulator